MTLRGAILFTVLGVFARAADVPYDFTGVLTADGKTRIALTNKATKTTEWVETGAQVGQYSIARYDAKDDAVFLKKGTEEIRLPLVAAKSAEPASTASALRAAGPVTVTPPVSPPPLPAPSPPTPPAPAPATAPTQNVIINVPTAPPPGAATGETAEAAKDTSGAMTPTGRESPSPSNTYTAPGPSYTIQGGDTWEKISASTGVSVDELKRLNPVVNGSSLPAGQTIRIR